MTRDPDKNFSDLITLDDACKFFLHGKVKVATLRALHKAGRLDIYRIGRRDFTTTSDLEGMKEKCRVEAPARASGSIRKEEHGLSSTVEADAARDSLLMNLDKLKKPSGNTSRRSMSSKTAPRRSSQTF